VTCWLAGCITGLLVHQQAHPSGPKMMLAYRLLGCFIQGKPLFCFVLSNQRMIKSPSIFLVNGR